MKKSTKIILVLVTVLIVIRLILPHFLLKEVNKTLANIDGYYGHMEDLDLHIYRGAYQFEGIVIEKTDGEMKSPFFKVDLVDISIDWSAIFKGEFAGEIEIEKPVLNFAVDSTSGVTQTGTENDWLETIDNLIPIDANLNLFALRNGTVKYSDYSMQPNVEVKISEIDIEATNLSNVKSKSEDLPSSFKMTGVSDGEGKLDVRSRLNILKEIPDFDLNFKLENVELTRLNDFTKAYGKFDFESGKMSLFSEVSMKNGQYDGYVKPVLENIKILVLSEEEESDGFFRKLWEGIVSIPTEVVENQSKDRFATKTPISGSIENTKVNVWKTLGNLFKNAFIKAIPKKIDDTINLKSVEEN